MINKTMIDRRKLLASLVALSAMASLRVTIGQASSSQILRIPIPKTGELLPVIGMGSWITFNVGNDIKARIARTGVLEAFFEAGGGLIDSSPMYGSSEEVIGHGLGKLEPQPGLFSATKVWTRHGSAGPREMERSRKLWGVERFDLLMVHNLVAWEEHLETLQKMKSAKQVRYIGVTTSHGRRHAELMEIMKTRPIDFVQFTYNVLDREAERDLLPLAKERGIAVIVNRPFRGGALFDRFGKQPLPMWASDFDCSNWAQFFLKFIVSHPAVTCAIPATSQIAHMRENMGAARGRMPDPKMRERMIRYLDSA